MVIGRGKMEQISKEPLLKCYFDIFKEVLCEGSHNLIVIGYGFGDEHINSVLAEAVQIGLKIYILSPESPEAFTQKLIKGYDQDREKIFKGLTGYSQNVDEILTGNKENLKIKERFYEVFFRY